MPTALAPSPEATLADQAMRDGAAGRAALPEELRPTFDRMRLAFAEYEAGRDDAAREAMGAIGLSSPFLEWKLLLRGMQAWAADDVPRALDNWSRLSAERLPAKLAAPFRSVVDKGYLATLPVAEANRVAEQAASLAGGLVEGLRRVRKLAASDRTFDKALDAARTVVPELKRVAPDAVPRLANVMYHAMIAGGHPEDLARYLRIFGAPVDDPQFFKLQAIITEGMGNLELAHGMWGKYADWIGRAGSRWPKEQADRARAILLHRMGGLARRFAEDDDDDDDGADDFFARLSGRKPITRKRPTLKPSAEECHRQAAKLAPDWIEPALALVDLAHDTPAKAMAELEKALKRFPDDPQMLIAAMEASKAAGDAAAAHGWFRKALAANPLDRNLRETGGHLALAAARRHAAAGELDAARTALAEARESLRGPALFPLHALAAIVETRAGGDAQTHEDALMRLPDGRVAAPLARLAEALRLKAKKKETDPLKVAYTATLREPATARELIAWLDVVRVNRRDSTAYVGQKTHEKAPVDAIKAAATKMPHPERIALGLGLHDRGMWKELRHVAQDGPVDDPWFRYFRGAAELGKSSSPRGAWRIALDFRDIARMAATKPEWRPLVDLVAAARRKYPRIEQLLQSPFLSDE